MWRNFSASERETIFCLSNLVMFFVVVCSVFDNLWCWHCYGVKLLEQFPSFSHANNKQANVIGISCAGKIKPQHKQLNNIIYSNNFDSKWACWQVSHQKYKASSCITYYSIYMMNYHIFLPKSYEFKCTFFRQNAIYFFPTWVYLIGGGKPFYGVSIVPRMTMIINK